MSPDPTHLCARLVEGQGRECTIWIMIDFVAQKKGGDVRNTGGRSFWREKFLSS